MTHPVSSPEAATEAASASAYDTLHLFIDGEWLLAGERATAPVINPASGRELGRVPLATAADLDRALDATARAFAVWRRTVPAERAWVLKGGAALVRERVGRIATLLTLEEGKPLAESRDEVLRAAEYFEWFAEEARRIDGRVVPSNRPGVQQFVRWLPIGPVAAFTLGSFPAITPARKLAAALAAGCSVVLKPGEERPAAALALARALDEAGLPRGVLQVVFGVPDEVSPRPIAAPAIRKVVFTGSAPVWRLLPARTALADGGRLVQVGMLGGGGEVGVALETTLYRHLQILGTVMKSRPQAEKHAMVRRFREHWLTRFSGGASLEPLVDSTFPPARAADAHRRMESAANVGKIILTMD
ncbi:aldehyde dehydrogenase family protein [Burkholderia plantarii]|uniref:aldehyde dehydrogenase family protein n=1 Tax=Burkholderia plantarii TaxID=41899 RepID=UPI0018DEB496|nr:aldehyde dehydrogenase family protein [Burkholderia plantarii]MBI0330987.1 aldehyde dehydrogenase family protein [Burkholderia plantarii]